MDHEAVGSVMDVFCNILEARRQSSFVILVEMQLVMVSLSPSGA